MFTASIGAFSWGAVLAWTGAALPYIAGCLNDCDYSYSAEQGSWIGSLAPLGCLVGCFANGFLMEIFGRKWTITGMAVPLIIGWSMMLIPKLAGIDPDITIYIFYIGRFVQGKFQDCLRQRTNLNRSQIFRVFLWCLYSGVKHIHFRVL